MSNYSNPKASDVSVEQFATIEAEERLVYECQKAIRALMKKSNVNAATLADRLGVSEARISQMMGANATNLTLRTLARVFHAMGTRASIAELEASPPLKLEADAGSSHVLEPESAAANIPAPSLSQWTKMFGLEPVGTLSHNVAYGSKTVWVLGDLMAPATSRAPRARRPQRDTSAWLSRGTGAEPHRKVAVNA